MIYSNVMPVRLANGHYYSLEVVGNNGKVHFDEIYPSREAAEKDMYRFINKNKTKIVETYEDNHDKTYICDNNVSFYIQRYC